jgi:hypothetical protein
MLRTGHLIHPASTPAFRPTSGASLPGTLASPRTGLSPAGSRELSLSSSPENSSSLDAPELSGRTPAQRRRGDLGDNSWARPTAAPPRSAMRIVHLALRSSEVSDDSPASGRDEHFGGAAQLRRSMATTDAVARPYVLSDLGEHEGAALRGAHRIAGRRPAAVGVPGDCSHRRGGGTERD